LAALVAAVLVLAPATARAEEPYVIETLGEHPRYRFEFEPVVGLAYAGPFNPHGALVFGARVALNLADGFVQSINDSVAISAGAEFDAIGNLLVPVALQWNFWFSDSWSMFFEPGAALSSSATTTVIPVGYLGARLHLNPRVALTLRAGFPDSTLGLTLLL
jgi:hypothetical protein